MPISLLGEALLKLDLLLLVEDPPEVDKLFHYEEYVVLALRFKSCLYSDMSDSLGSRGL